MKKIVITFFLLFLLSPTLASFMEYDYEMYEKRQKIQRPAVTFSSVLRNNFSDEFNAYFNDNFTLRGLFILSKNWIDFYFFHVSPSEKVHLGIDQWLFRKIYLSHYEKNECEDEAYIEQLVLHLRAMERVVKLSGRNFFMAVAPNKSTIYPEYVGYTAKPNSCGKSRLDLFLEEIAEYPISGFKNLEPVLKAGKDKEKLFFKTDTHWNHAGARLAAKTILHELFPTDSPSIPLFNYYQARVRGDLAIMLALPTVSEEDFLAPNLKVQDYVLRGDRPIPFMITEQTPSNSEATTAILYGDSMSTWLIPYLSPSFKRLDTFRTHNIPSNSAYPPPDNMANYEFILLEATETDLKNIRIDLAGVVKLLDPYLKIPKRVSLDRESIVPQQNITIKETQQGTIIYTLGPKATFELANKVPSSDKNTLRILRLELDSKTNGYINISYASKDHQFYSHPNQQLFVRPGANDLQFPLPFWGELTVQLQLTSQHEVHRLRSMELHEYALEDPNI